MINDVLMLIGWLGVFRIFIYAIGEPHNEYNPKAILAWWPSFICQLRGRYLGVESELTIPDATCRTKAQEISIKETIRIWAVEAVMPYAGFTSILGLCPTCTSVWFYAFTIFIPSLDNGFAHAFGLYGASLLLSKISIKWI